MGRPKGSKNKKSDVQKIIAETLTVIDNTKPKAPMYVRHEIPDFRTTLEEDKYWATERQRWVEGYGDISGPEYFFIQEFTIKNAAGAEIRPWWRDVDHFVFEAIKDCKTREHDLFVMKRREVGLSTIGGGLLPVWHALTMPGSTSLMTSADKTRVEKLFAEKTMIGFENLDESFRPSKARLRQSGELFMAKEDTKSRGSFTGLKSWIVSRETSDSEGSVGNFESFRAVYCFLDELFLHPRAAKVRASTARCFMDGAHKLGFMLMGGTCGLSTQKGALEGKEIYLNSKDLNIATLFLKGTLGIKQFSTNGWSDEKAAEEWIMRERERLSRVTDRTEFYKFITDYPLTEDEILDNNIQSVFPQDVAQNLARQKRAIVSRETPPVGKYQSFWGGSHNGVGFEKINEQSLPGDKDKALSGLHILEMPEPGASYVCGIDAIPFNTGNEDGSEFCLAIKKRLADTYVAYYAERSIDSGYITGNAIRIQTAYNNAVAMLEINRGGVIKKEYMDAGRKDLLAPRPTELGIKWTDSKESIGFYKNDKTAEHLTNYLVKYLKQHANKLYFPRQVEELMKYLVVNTDLVDAMEACELYEAELTKRGMRVARPTIETKKIVVIERGPDGKSRWVEKEVYVNTGMQVKK